MIDDRTRYTIQEEDGRKNTDWEKYSGIKTSSKQKILGKELQEQIKENGIYSIFAKQNSKVEMTKQLNERNNENWKRRGIIISGIGVFIAIVKILLGIEPH